MTAPLPERLQTAMTLRGLRAVDLSRAADVRLPTLETYLYGRAQPKAENLTKLATALHCSADYLLGLRDELHPSLFETQERVSYDAVIKDVEAKMVEARSTADFEAVARFYGILSDLYTLKGLAP